MPQFRPFPKLEKLSNFACPSGLIRNSIFLGRRTWSTQNGEIAPPTNFKFALAYWVTLS